VLLVASAELCRVWERGTWNGRWLAEEGCSVVIKFRFAQRDSTSSRLFH